MNRLQKALGINAVFSGISGIGQIFFHKSIADLFGLSNSTAFWIIGIGLVFFALTIILEVIKQRPIAVLWIIIQDFLWVFGSLLLLAFQPFGISNTGNIVILAISFIVLMMALNQSYALSSAKTS